MVNRLLLVVGLAVMAQTSRVAVASADLDRLYSLDTIGALRAWDNVDGLFGDYVAGAYKEYFAHQTRFRQVDLSHADALLGTSKVPYAKAIDDTEILAQLSRSLKTQSLVRTKIFKEGAQYRFTIDWLHSPDQELLASEVFTLEDKGASREGAAFEGLGDIKGGLQAALNRLFAKVPFVGQVTGRDNDDVTLNLGASSGVKRGDTLLIATIDEVKKHPLLKQIVEWRMTDVGRVEIDSVDEGLAFGHVAGQEEGREIARYQKVTKIIPKPVVGVTGGTGAGDTPPNLVEESPKLGFARLSAWTGIFSRDYSNSTPVGFSGKGFFYGARGAGELWLNRSFFLDADFGYGAFGYSQSTSAGAATPGGQVGGSLFTILVDVGYTYLLTQDFFGPRAWVKAGYMSTSSSLPVNATTEFTNPYTIGSVFLGIGGDLPIRGDYGVRMELDFGVFNNGSESGNPDGSTAGSNNATFYVGGYYRYRPRIQFQFGAELQTYGSNFNNNSATLTQKTITVLPAVNFLF